MAGFVTGADRTQGTMFPAQLEDYVAADNPVRVIDFFIDQLDLAKLGFCVKPKETGKLARLPPRGDAEIYVYGYLNRVQSSRRLERGMPAQCRGDVADRAAWLQLQDHRRFPQGQRPGHAAKFAASSSWGAGA